MACRARPAHERDRRWVVSEFSFYWHDYETFGRAPRRDRPSQFAGVRTDEQLREIGQPLMIYCKPGDDYLPEPEACLLTGILPQDCLQRGLPEPEFAARIREELARPATIGVGYNSIRFDDEVTRHLFWRNLLDPYSREWQHGCGRWDLLNVARCAWALRPQGLEWPSHPDGRPSFKLEDLSAANGLLHEAAHDALSDVRATIGLARLIRQANSRLWDFCLRLRRKDEVLAETGLDKPQAEWRAFLHLHTSYGPQRGYLALVWPLAQNPRNKSEYLLWDLAQDPQQLEALVGSDPLALRARLNAPAADAQDQPARLPITRMQINKSPIVIGNLRTVSGEQAQRWGLDLALGQAHATTMASLLETLRLPWGQVLEAGAPTAPVDVDEDLYGGFLGTEDRQRLESLRQRSPSDWGAGLPHFDDARLGELVFRYRARNFPNSLDPQEQQRWQDLRSRRLLHGEGGGLSLPAFFERIDVLGQELDDDDERGQEILGALYDWAERIAP